jgi:hypothetical protein
MKNNNPRFEFSEADSRFYKAGNWNAIWNTDIYQDNHDLDDVIKASLSAEEKDQIIFDSESCEFYAYLRFSFMVDKQDPQQLAKRFTEIIKNDIIRKLFNQS